MNIKVLEIYTDRRQKIAKARVKIGKSIRVVRPGDLVMNSHALVKQIDLLRQVVVLENLSNQKDIEIGVMSG